MTKPRRTPPPPRGGAPDERWQHGAQYEVIAGGCQRVTRPVEALRRNGRIGDAEVVASERYYNDYAFAVGAKDPELSGSGGSLGGYTAAQLDAIGHSRDAQQAIGYDHTVMLANIVILERSIVAIAGSPGGWPRERTARLAVAALKALADHYAQVDGNRPGGGSKIRSGLVD